MRLDDLDPTQNARDLGSGGGGGGGFGLLGLLPLLLGRGRLGCGTIAILGLVALAFMFMNGGGGGLAPTRQVQTGAGAGGYAANGQACDTQAELFSCRVMTLTEQTWTQLFRAQGGSYRPATINFYSGNVQSGCGGATSAAGPFYCPADQGVYLDTAFFQELSQRFGAAGDFAQAYVIAHEIGHHVQNLTGIAGEVTRAQQRAGQAEGNALSVRLELQADCYAGVWAARNRDRLEPGDIEEGLRAAEAIGDDTLASQAGARMVPESFTHGTSAQRMRWLRAGLESGNPAACDTFSGAI